MSLVLTFGDGERRYLSQNCCIWLPLNLMTSQNIKHVTRSIQSPADPSRLLCMARLYSRTTVKKIVKAHNPRSSLSKNVDVMVDTIEL